ncbi:MAG: ABC transporter ATP-binding protein [Hungatella sp.]|nr:ABC transporter ATP-binding protein [Hungatella sp.]
MVEIRGLCKEYRGKDVGFPVLSDVTLQVFEGDFLVILGQSGCGKTTLLRLIGGFLEPDRGEVSLDGEPVRTPSAQMIMVFQSFDQLFPWFTLKENITYALKKAKKGRDKSVREETALGYLDMAGLSGFADSYPHTLSGGMKQRGALARALALEPRVLLMDEPFSSLDYLTRKQAQDALKSLAAANNSTVILVTHDIEEALKLGTRIAVLDRSTHRIEKIYEGGQIGPYLREELEEALL